MTTSTTILCDGCGLPATPQHIAERVQRLERATRYRPIHIDVLFVAMAPVARAEDDFYGAQGSPEFFDTLLDGVEIQGDAGLSGPESGVARLLEFQKKGCYLTFVSECALIQENSADPDGVAATALEHISRLAPALIRRIRFNYRPKNVALLGGNLNPLVEILRQSEIAPLLLLDQGLPLRLPAPRDAVLQARFQGVLTRKAASEATPAGM